MITKVKIVSITVRDQQKALEFYTEKLGFTLVNDQPMGDDKGTRWIELALPEGGAIVNLFPPQGAETKIGGLSNIIFNANDVQQTYDELKERGVVFIEPPTQQHWGTYCIFADPDDNRFVLSAST
ncbi:MAG: VOC family protein [Acidobacteria bacterium]|nr:VOC family protein [Acidobacteriota bacterium]